jgi:hypothetical protein
MSIQSNFPAIKPTLLLDFANVEQLDPRITFSRASTGTFYGTQTAKAEQNLALGSQDFATYWGNTATTDTPDSSVAPDGTTTADTITEDSSLNFHIVDQATSSSGVLTLSVFAKLGSGTRSLTIGLSRDASNHGSATFDLSSGINTQTQANGTYSGASASVTASANGFYRCSLTITTDTVSVIRIGLNDTGTPATNNRGFGVGYTGDGTSSLILWGAQLEQRSAVTAYTATTTQPITNYISQLQTAASGVARFDHNPITDESLGLLIEELRSNLQINSENVDGANWAKSAIISQLNIAIAPDGNQTADKIIPNTANSAHHVESGTTVVAGTQYTASVYLKAAEETVAVLWNNAVGAVATFNLSTGTVTSGTGVITPVGNGWYRCSILYTPSGTNGQIRYYPRQSTAFAGNDFSGIFIWGAQLEVGAFPTSYVATVASQVTRAADAASMTGANFSSWFSNAEGTLYAEFNPLALAASSGVVINDNTTSNRIRLATTSVSDQGTVTTSGTAQAVLDGGTPAANTSMKLAMTYQVNNFALSLNGATAATDTTGTVPVVSQLQIGSETTTVGNLRIKKMAYYPIVSTATQLQGLTS